MLGLLVIFLITSCGLTALGKTVITWSNPDSLQWQSTYEAIADAFMEQNPNIEIRIINTPQSGYLEKTLTSIAAGTAPDIITWYFSSDTFEKGFIEELTPYMERDGFDPKTAWLPIAENRAEYQGRYYSVPRDAVYLTLVINEQIFEDAGVPVPTDDWTPEEMRELLSQVVDYDQGIFGIAGVHTHFALESHPFAFTLGARVIDDTGRTVKGYLDSPETIEAIQFLFDLIEDGLTVPDFFMEQAGSSELGLFMSGQVAVSTIAWNRQRFYETDLRWKPIAPPVKEGIDDVAWGDSVQYYMWTGSENKDAAWEFMKFASGYEAGLIAAKSNHWTPPNPEVWLEMGWDTEYLHSSLWQRAQVPSELAPYLRSEFYREAVRPHLANIWTRYLELGERPLEDIVRDEANQAQEDLDRCYRRR